MLWFRVLKIDRLENRQLDVSDDKTVYTTRHRSFIYHLFMSMMDSGHETSRQGFWSRIYRKAVHFRGSPIVGF